MKIENLENEYSLPFGVNVKICTGFNREVHGIALMAGRIKVTLSKEECQELLNVISGEKCSTVALFEEGAYQAHTVFHYSAPEDQRVQYVCTETPEG